MIRLVRVELLKLRTTRLWIVMLAVGVAMVALIVVVVLASNGSNGSSGAGPARTEDGRRRSDAARYRRDRGALALVIGATMATSEYRYATAGRHVPGDAATARVVTAKMLAAVPVGALFGLVGACVPLLVALAWFAAKGDSVPLDHTIPSRSSSSGSRRSSER